MINDIRKIMEEYEPDHSIWSTDDIQITRLKEAVQNLNDADKIIFILYCETGSLREVGKMLGVSHTTAYKCIKDIKKKILEYVDGPIDD